MKIVDFAPTRTRATAKSTAVIVIDMLIQGLTFAATLVLLEGLLIMLG